MHRLEDFLLLMKVYTPLKMSWFFRACSWNALFSEERCSWYHLPEHFITSPIFEFARVHFRWTLQNQIWCWKCILNSKSHLTPEYLHFRRNHPWPFETVATISVVCYLILCCKHSLWWKTVRKIGQTSVQTAELLKIDKCTEHRNIFAMYTRVYFLIISHCALKLGQIVQWCTDMNITSPLSTGWNEL